MNWLATLLDLLKSFWPLALVSQWERGFYVVWGHALKRQIGPGIYPFIPWFMDVSAVSIVPAPVSTPLLNITLRDGRTVGYSVTAIVQVTDVWHAINSIDNYKESTSECVASKVSEKLGEVDASRLDSDKRRRFLSDLLRWVNEDTNQFGVEVRALRFTNFALNQRAYRILADSALASSNW